MADWGGGLKGASGGALAGSALGGIPGAVVGGAVGGLAGLWGSGNPNDDKLRAQQEWFMKQLGGREADQMGAPAQSGYSDFRGNQTGLVNRLETMANGQGPSVSREQFKAATDRNNAQQMAMAASGHGGPLAAMGAANNMGQLGAQAAQGSAMGRVAEQMGAIQQLGGTINQGRQADENTNQWNAGAQNDQMRANLDARLKGMQLNDDARLRLMSLMGGNNQAQATRPGLGDQVLAGGAGLYSMGTTQAAQQAASAGGGKRSYSQWGDGGNRGW